LENIVAFLSTCQKRLGFGSEQLFDTINLYETKIQIRYHKEEKERIRKEKKRGRKRRGRRGGFKLMLKYDYLNTLF
jgi:hypothetical protein